MKRRAKYSLIIVVVLVVILGVGFGIWKIFFAPRPPKPLMIKDLENMHITTTRGTTSGDWCFAIVTLPRAYLGRVHDNRNAFDPDDTIDIALRVYLKCVQGAIPPNVRAGDTLEITYDGGQTLLIYCPAITENTDLYLASDGSTYYDEDLTKLAWSPDSVKPLIIKDLEDVHITITRSSEKEGWVYIFREAAWPGGLGIEFGAPDGGVLDYENIYRDGDTSTVPLPLKFRVGPADICPEVQAGDTIEITYNGGQTLLIYLPAITEGTSLYVTPDGSTYYDKALTQPAQLAPSEGKI